MDACFFETSAKTGENVNEIFTQIASKLPKTATATGADAITIVGTDEAPTSKGKCCK